MMKRSVLFISLSMLAACDNGSVRDTLGLHRTAPDAFQVISRPPLSVPPDFNLRPPADPTETNAMGAVISPRHDAEALVLGGGSALQPGTAPTAIQPVQQGTLSTAADAYFLKKAGADDLNPNIRAVLLRESPPPSLQPEKSLIERIREPDSNEPMVNAMEEAQRLKDNKAAGKAPTEGTTPMITPKDRGPLRRLLGE